MILGVGQYNITEEEEKYSLPLPGKQFDQGKAPRNGSSKLDLGSSGFVPLSLCEIYLLCKGGAVWEPGTDLKA